MTEQEPQKQEQTSEKPKPKYTIVKTHSIEFNKNKFLEVARKRMDIGGEILTFSKGFISRGQRQYNKIFGVPYDPKTVDELVKSLESLKKVEK